jgi:hypothetical protein
MRMGGATSGLHRHAAWHRIASHRIARQALAVTVAFVGGSGRTARSRAAVTPKLQGQKWERLYDTSVPYHCFLGLVPPRRKPRAAAAYEPRANRAAGRRGHELQVLRRVLGVVRRLSRR